MGRNRESRPGRHREQRQSTRHSHFTDVIITRPPMVTAASYLYSKALNKLRFTFDSDVSASLLASNLTVSPGGIVATDVTWNSATKTATVTCLADQRRRLRRDL
jgi:hypothetical protein